MKNRLTLPLLLLLTTMILLFSCTTRQEVSTPGICPAEATDEPLEAVAEPEITAYDADGRPPLAIT